MSLPEIREVELQAFVDGQLPEGRYTAVLAHLGHHPHEIERLAEYARHKEELRRGLEAVNLTADDPTTAELQRTLADRLSRRDYRRWLRQVATVVLLLAAGWSSHGMYQKYLESRIPQLVIKAAQAHEVFGADRQRPVELTAASTAEMAAWFSSRLGEPVEIPILATMGLRLIGGRQEIELVEVGDLTAGYWQDGDLTYTLVGATPDAQLIAIASELGAQEPANRL
jgi:anti-sigma factor RsiW